MSSMNFQLVLEIVDKATDALKKITAAEKALENASKSANTEAAKGAEKAQKALEAEAKAAAAAAKAQKDLEAAAKGAGSASADAAGRATQANERSLSVLERMKAAGAAAGAAISAGFGKAVDAAGRAASAVGKVGGMIGRAGKSAGADFAKGIAAGVKAELPGLLKAALSAIWSKTTGLGLMSGPGAFRGNMQALTQQAVGRGGAMARAAAATAYSNVQGAVNLDEQLSPDLGVEGARKARQAADAYLKSSPFRRDDVRAALPDAARTGVGVGDRTWNALLDAAASQNMTPQAALSAWAEMKKGNRLPLEQLGIKAKADDYGKVTGLSYMTNGAAQNVEVAGDIEAKVTAAMEARFSGAAARKGASVDGFVTQAINSWDAFIGKVMDSGPYDFVRQKFADILADIQKTTGADGVEALAKKIGGDIVDAMKTAYEIVKTITGAISAVKTVLDPVVVAFGGWKNVIIALMALQMASWVTTLLAPLAMVGSALATATTAAAGFAAALLANPITWIVAGVLALAAAAYYVYNNWATIGPKLAAIWDDLSTAAEAAWEGVKDRAEDAWNSVAETVKTAVEATQAAATEGWDTAIEAVKTAWERHKTYAETAWVGLKDSVVKALDAVTAAISEWGGKALAAMQQAFEPVSKWFETAAGKIGALWDTVSSGVKKAAAYVGIGDKQGVADDDAIARAGRAQEAVSALTTLRVQLEQLQAAVQGFDLAGPITAAINTSRSAVAGVSFHSEGIAMMNTLAAGIRAGAASAVGAVREVTQRLRDHLPHSPAKEGPLSDLDKIRFSETLALAIRPDPAVDAVRAVAAGMAGAVRDPEIGVVAGARGVGAAALAGGGGQGGTGGPVSVSYAPNIQIPPGGDAKSFADQLRAHAHELAQIIKSEARQNGRLRFEDA
jgi:hypothetical protein